MESLMEVIPAGQTAPRVGTVVTVNGVRRVNVDGNPLLASWADPVVVDDGDSVDVLIYSSGVGQFRVKVTGRSTSQPRPRTGTVTQVPAGSPTITVLAASVSYAAEPVGGPYSVGNLVHLDWGAGKPRVIGKVTLTPSPEGPGGGSGVTPPPTGPVSGTVSAAALSSRTWNTLYGWGTWAGDGSRVYQGTWAGATTTGAWFYGAPFGGLVGRKISRIQFLTGARLGVGNNNAPATFHFYTHTHPSQPGGDTNRIDGPFNWTAPPGAGPTWIDLPVAMAATLIAGGGIAIQGEPYAGMIGAVAQSPDSGSIIIHWTT